MKMFRVVNIAFSALLAAWHWGCGSGDSSAEVALDTPRDTAGTFLMGHAVFGHEVRSVRPCGGGETLWAIDSSQTLWDLHRELAPGLEPYEEVFVVLRGTEGNAPSDGFGADFPGALNVDAVVYAATEGFGCDLELGSFVFRISGNEPFWTLRLAGDSAQLSRMDGPGRVWTDVRVSTTASGFTFEGDDIGFGSLEVFIRADPCRDSMSGAYHAFQASVRIEGEELMGCAIHGIGN